MNHAHVDVLGLIGGDKNLVLRCGQQGVVLVLRHGLQLGGRLVVLGDGFAQLLLAHGAIVEHTVLVLAQLTQQLEQFGGVLLLQLLGGEQVTGAVVLAIDAVLHQGAEVALLVGLGVGTALGHEAHVVEPGGRVGLGVADDMLQQS